MPKDRENNRVVSVRFREVSKAYHFDANGVQNLKAGDFVVVETARGREIGQVIQTGPLSLSDRPSLKPVKRRATARDMAIYQRFKLKEKETLNTCRQTAEEMGLPLRIARVEYSYDGQRLTVFYMSEERADYRSFRKKLSQSLRVRVEMQSMSPRDFAKMIGGCGACGGPLCCSTFLTEFVPVSIKTAKAQDIPLVPAEITGMCGRLRCCLRYEYETYQEAKRAMPQKGRQVVTPYGRGKIVATNLLKETVVVDFGTHRSEVPLAGLQVEPRDCKGNCGAKRDARSSRKKRR
jgi:cell fate regulator YaaT (PSP1 superfamily)